MASTSTTYSAPSRTPALEPPEGVTSNFDDPPSLAYWSNVTIGVCLPLATIFFLLRCYVRIWIKRVWDLEDWLVFFSWGGTAGFCALVATTIANGGGRHLWDLVPEQAHAVSFWFNATATEYAFFIAITKIAVLWLYRRAFSPKKGSLFEYSVYIMIFSFVVFYGVTGFAKIFECNPRSKIFDNEVPGTCLDLFAILVADGVFNTISDFIILFMPAMVLYRLQMSRKKKLIILAIFTFGLSAPIFSVIGLVVRVQLGANPDFSWNLIAILLWAVAELTTAVMCVCMPEYGLLFNRKSRKSFSKRGPTESILQGAKSAIKRSQKKAPNSIPFSAIYNQDSDSDLTGNPYRELDHNQKTETNAMPEPHHDMDIPLGQVHVKHDVRVDYV